MYKNSCSKERYASGGDIEKQKIRGAGHDPA
jgi:hypothetical protein